MQCPLRTPAGNKEIRLSNCCASGFAAIVGLCKDTLIDTSTLLRVARMLDM